MPVLHCQAGSRRPPQYPSSNPKILQYFRSLDEDRRPVILQFQPEKDETDTELAMRIAMERGCDVIHLLGATGNRLDHMLGPYDIIWRYLLLVEKIHAPVGCNQNAKRIMVKAIP